MSLLPLTTLFNGNTNSTYELLGAIADPPKGAVSTAAGQSFYPFKLVDQSTDKEGTPVRAFVFDVTQLPTLTDMVDGIMWISGASIYASPNGKRMWSLRLPTTRVTLFGRDSLVARFHSGSPRSVAETTAITPHLVALQQWLSGWQQIAEPAQIGSGQSNSTSMEVSEPRTSTPPLPTTPTSVSRSLTFGSTFRMGASAATSSQEVKEVTLKEMSTLPCPFPRKDVWSATLQVVSTIYSSPVCKVLVWDGTGATNAYIEGGLISRSGTVPKIGSIVQLKIWKRHGIVANNVLRPLMWIRIQGFFWEQHGAALASIDNLWSCQPLTEDDALVKSRITAYLERKAEETVSGSSTDSITRTKHPTSPIAKRHLSASHSSFAPQVLASTSPSKRKESIDMEVEDNSTGRTALHTSNGDRNASTRPVPFVHAIPPARQGSQSSSPSRSQRQASQSNDMDIDDDATITLPNRPSEWARQLQIDSALASTLPRLKLAQLSDESATIPPLFVVKAQLVGMTPWPSSATPLDSFRIPYCKHCFGIRDRRPPCPQCPTSFNDWAYTIAFELLLRDSDDFTLQKISISGEDAERFMGVSLNTLSSKAEEFLLVLTELVSSRPHSDFIIAAIDNNGHNMYHLNRTTLQPLSAP